MTIYSFGILLSQFFNQSIVPYSVLTVASFSFAEIEELLCLESEILQCMLLICEAAFPRFLAISNLENWHYLRISWFFLSAPTAMTGFGEAATSPSFIEGAGFLVILCAQDTKLTHLWHYKNNFFIKSLNDFSFLFSFLLF